MDLKKKLGIGLIVCGLVLVSILGTYAYFITSINNDRPQELEVTTGTMSMIFSDNSAGINKSLKFDETVTKDFKIRNTGTLPVSATINWDGLVNTYLGQSLSYTLQYATEEGGTYQSVTTTSPNVPNSPTASTQALAENLVIPAGETYFYRLSITLDYLDDVDQTQDFNANFSTKFNVGEYRSVQQ